MNALSERLIARGKQMQENVNSRNFATPWRAENEVLQIKEKLDDVVERNERLEDVVSTQRETIEQLEEELSETRERNAALEEKLSSGPRSQPQPTLHLKVIKRGVP